MANAAQEWGSERTGATDRTVREVMRPLATGCLQENRVVDVLEVMQELGVEALPVVDALEGGSVQGMVTRRAAAAAAEADPDARVADCEMAEAPEVDPDAPAIRALGHAVDGPGSAVVDGDGNLIGVVD